MDWNKLRQHLIGPEIGTQIELANAAKEYSDLPPEFFDYSFNVIDKLNNLLTKKVDNLPKLQKIKPIEVILDPILADSSWLSDTTSAPLNNKQALLKITSPEKINWFHIHHVAKLLGVVGQRNKSFKIILSKVRANAKIKEETGIARESFQMLAKIIKKTLGRVSISGITARNCDSWGFRVFAVEKVKVEPNDKLLKIVEAYKDFNYWGHTSFEEARTSGVIRGENLIEVGPHRIRANENRKNPSNWFLFSPLEGTGEIVNYRSVMQLISDLAREVSK